MNINYKEEILDKIKQNNETWNFVPKELLYDKDFIKESLLINPRAVIYIAELVENDLNILMNFDKEAKRLLKTNKDFAIKYLKDDLKCKNLTFVNNDFVEEVIYEIVKENPSYMIHLNTYCNMLEENHKEINNGINKFFKNVLDSEFKKEKDLINFKNDLQEAIDNNSLDTFKQNYSKYFKDNNLEK